MSENTSSPSAPSAAEEEPKKTNAKFSGAKPATVTIAHDSVVGAGDADTIRYSSARPSPQRKVLTVLHIQRRLAAEGFTDVVGSPSGTYDVNTRNAVSAYQESLDAPATGVLTREQFTGLFHGDPNVSLEMDTIADHDA